MTQSDSETRSYNTFDDQRDNLPSISTAAPSTHYNPSSSVHHASRAPRDSAPEGSWQTGREDIDVSIMTLRGERGCRAKYLVAPLSITFPVIDVFQFLRSEA